MILFFLKVEGKSDDQDFFNKVIVEEGNTKQFGLKLLILPNTVYNARPWIWKKMKAEKIRGRMKIVHAHKLPRTRLIEIQRALKGKLNLFMKTGS